MHDVRRETAAHRLRALRHLRASAWHRRAKGLSAARCGAATSPDVWAAAAVATSGTYARFFRHAGHRYHHLLDPETGAPRETLVRSLTVRADSCMQADVAATALFGMSRERAARVLASCAPGGEVIRTA